MAHESDLYDFTVTEHAEGKARTRKTLGRLIPIAVIVALFAALIAIFKTLATLFVILLIVFLAPLLALWKWFNLEYKYELISGNMSFYVMHGSKIVNTMAKPKPRLSLTIKDMETIAPYTPEAKAAIAAANVKKSHVYISSFTKGQDIYYAIFEQNGEKQVVYFEMTQRALQILYYYNHNTVKSNVYR